MLDTAASFQGRVRWELTGPDGALKDSGEQDNVITQTGDQRLAEAGALAAPTVAIPSGMQIGTGGATAAAKTGAGSGMVAYTIGRAFDATPTSGLNGGSPNLRTITFVCTYPAGVGTANGINEAGIVNGTVTTAGTPNGTTLARTVLTTAVNKAAADTLTITWVWTIGS